MEKGTVVTGKPAASAHEVWLFKHGESAFHHLWNLLCETVDIVDNNGFVFHEERDRLIDTVHSTAPEFMAWVSITKKACWMDINEGQEDVWKCIFGDQRTSARKHAERLMNDKGFMNWRKGMSHSNMLNGISLSDLNHYIEKKAGEQGHARGFGQTSMMITRASGMGPATTYLHGDAHIELQVGKFGSTLAQTFYKDPIVVFERFRVKTFMSWGLGHVDHRVRSRTENYAL